VFTGIVETAGRVTGCTGPPSGRRLEIATELGAHLRTGESVAVNGCCLTVVAPSAAGFAADVIPETLERSALGDLRTGDRVNLERAMRLDGRLDGHLVQGHVDGVGTVRDVRREDGACRIVVELPPALAAYVAEKGSIAVDGISLTVTRVDADRFEVALIPHTLEHTIAGEYRPGRRVNLEVDLIARYVARLLASKQEDA
jgi:riboflavin synthase alpha subunit